MILKPWDTGAVCFACDKATATWALATAPTCLLCDGCLAKLKAAMEGPAKKLSGGRELARRLIVLFEARAEAGGPSLGVEAWETATLLVARQFEAMESEATGCLCVAGEQCPLHDRPDGTPKDSPGSKDCCEAEVGEGHTASCKGCYECGRVGGHRQGCRAAPETTLAAHALTQALAYLKHRDRMNAVVHLGEVRWSPITDLVRRGLRAERTDK